MTSHDLHIGKFLDNMIPSNQKGGNIQKSKNRFSGIMRGLLADPGVQSKIKKIYVSSEGFKPEGFKPENFNKVKGNNFKGNNLIEQLKKYIFSNGINLDKAFLNKTGLLELQKLLVDAGFDKTKVALFIKDLKENGPVNSLKLSNLFAKITDMDALVSEDDNENMFEISALPFIESILSMLGMEHESIKEVLKEAKIEGKGIDIARLASNLKYMLKRQSENVQSNPYLASKDIASTGMASKDMASRGMAEKLMSQIGLSGDTKKGHMTLEEFASRLEGMLAGKSELKSINVITEDINRFMKNVQTQRDPNVGTIGAQINAGIIKLNAFGSKSQKGGDKFSLEKQKFGKKNVARGKTDANGSVVGGLVKDIKTPEEFKEAFEGLNKGSGKGSFEGLGKGSGDSLLQKNNAAIFEKSENMQGKTAQGNKNHSDDTLFSIDSLVKDSNREERISMVSGTKSNGRTLPSYVLDQVSRQILRAFQNNDNEIKLQLKPPHLGRLQMSIESTNNGFKVGIITENPATREMLLSHISELRSILMDQGLHLEKIDVQISYNFDQSTAKGKQELNNSKGRKHSEFKLSDAEDIENFTGSQEDERSFRKDGVLDLVA